MGSYPSGNKKLQTSICSMGEMKIRHTNLLPGNQMPHYLWHQTRWKLPHKSTTSERRTHHYCNSINHVFVCSPRESVQLALTILALNGLDILAFDIQNSYQTVHCRDLIWTMAGPKFGLEEGSIMVVKMFLCGLKASGAAFRAKLASLLHNIGYTPSKEDPDVWIRPAIKSDRTEYYKYSLV